MNEQILEMKFAKMNAEIKILNERMIKRLDNKEELADFYNKMDLKKIKHLKSAQFELENSSLGNGKLHVQLINYFNKWLDTEDLDYVDLIVVLLSNNNMVIKGVLLQALSIASTRRLKRDCNSGKKTDYSKKIKIDIDDALPLTCEKIFFLREFCQQNSDQANFLAIGWLTMNYPNPPVKKSSSLVSKYRVWINENAQFIQDIKDTFPSGWTKEEQTHYLEKFPVNIPEELRGVPRT